MSVNRIRKLDIHHRPFITAIYGALSFANKQEFFIEPNIISVHRWQELYLYLKEENYDTLFYSKDLGFFSYEQKPLRLITHPKNRVEEQEKTTVEASTKDYGCKFSRPIFDSPQKDNNEKESANIDNSDSKADSRIQSVYKPQYGGKLYNLKPQIPLSNIIPDIRCFAETNREFHLTIIITNPEEFTLDSNKEEQITGLLSIHQSATPFKTRLLIVYDAECEDDLVRPWSKEPTPFFYSESIRNIFKRPDDKSQYYFNPSLFYIGKIEEDDIINFLNKRRLDNPVLNSVLFERMSLNEIARKLSIEFPMRDSNSNLIKAGGKQVYYSTNSELNKATDESIIATITSLTSDSAWIRLNKLCGIDDIKQKITDYVQEIKEQLENNIPIHPHLFLSGNPGTGKTTLARLIGEILKEEGILSRGHFVETKPGDFLSDYIGGTRPKTMQKCNEAQGGVLFIDEAYGLYNGKDDQNNQYGKEAVEVLLTYMENVKDMVIIFAGYPHDMDQLLKANAGFARRIDKHHFWLIQDYEPEILVEIGKHLFAKGGYTMTKEFEALLPKLYDYRFLTRDVKTWGNAGSAEDIARYCISGYKKTKRKNKNLDIDCIDPETLSILKTMGNHTKQRILSAEEELASRIGMESIRKQFDEYIEEYENARLHPLQKEFRPHIIFKGNPGTGKTTAARLLGRIMKEKGLLKRDVFIEQSGGEMQDQYVGGTPQKVKELCERASGGILFIDEAHRLYDKADGGGRWKYSYNDEVIGVLMRELENNPDFICIFAGYSQKMDDFIKNADPGFERRVPNTIFFNDYNPDDLYKIALDMLSEYEMTDKFKDYLKRLFKFIYSHRHPYRFGNAGTVQNIVTKIKSQYRRLYREELKNGEAITLDIDSIPDEYIRHVIPPTKEQKEIINQQLNKLIGLKEVKEGIKRVLNRANNARLRADRGLQNDNDKPDLTFVFRGNPGTGKTTVANMIGSILSSYGLIVSPDVHLHGREKLIHDPDRMVKEMFDESFGAVLFIDEAHQLANDQAGREVMKKIVALMENNTYRGNLAIILAGYPEPMDILIAVDRGGKRRFRNSFDFKDFTLDELWEILENRARERGYNLTSECRTKVDDWFSVEKQEKDFGNAGTAENFLETIIGNQNERVSEYPNEDNEFWTTIVPEDIPIAVNNE